MKGNQLLLQELLLGHIVSQGDVDTMENQDLNWWQGRTAGLHTPPGVCTLLLLAQLQIPNNVEFLMADVTL